MVLTVLEQRLTEISETLTTANEENATELSQIKIQLRRIADALDWITEHGVKTRPEGSHGR